MLHWLPSCEAVVYVGVVGDWLVMRARQEVAEALSAGTSYLQRGAASHSSKFFDEIETTRNNV